MPIFNKMITLKKIRQDTYKVDYENGVELGYILVKEDGFYDFWPEPKGGYWPAYILHEIANKLDELNKPWEDIIMNDPTISANTH